MTQSGIMFQATFISTILAFLLSAIVFFSVWQYQRRTLTWSPVPIDITSSEIEHSRRGKRRGRVWTATVNYSFDGTNYTKTINNLPLGATQIYVDPLDPSNVAGERGATFQALFVPGLALGFTGLLLVVLGLIKFSPKDD